MTAAVLTRKKTETPKKSAEKKPSAPKKLTTRLSIRLDCGFPNFLSIRGEGAKLSWKKGLTLKNVAANEWIFETDASFDKCEFKILLNDEIYEMGPNRVLVCGTHSHYTPKF